MTTDVSEILDHLNSAMIFVLYNSVLYIPENMSTYLSYVNIFAIDRYKIIFVIRRLYDIYIYI